MMSVCLAYYVRCSCDLEGKLNGKKHRDCAGWGVLLEELPPKPAHTRRGQLGLPFTGNEAPSTNSGPQQ